VKAIGEFCVKKLSFLIIVLATAFLCLSNGCGEKALPPVERAAPPKPKEAATQLDRAFAGANAEVKSFSSAASQALQTADYEGAVQSLQMIREKGGLTADQGMAVHNSMVSLEAKLISAMSSGDANAKRAYEQLRKSRKN
jgi:hypothetical protein